MSTVPLNALRVFEAVARTGSFRAAAEDLFVTQSAVSHQIRHLEDWLGSPLFMREGNRARLLPHGAELSRALSGAFASIHDACQRAKADRQDKPLVIAAIPSVAMCWLIPQLAGFRQAHPEIEIRVVYAMHGQDINFRETHVAFVFAPEPPDIAGVDAVPFLPGACVAVCSPALAVPQDGAVMSPRDIVTLGLLHDADTSGWTAWMRLAGLNPPPSLSGAVFEDFNLLRIAALSGQGVALCASAMIQPDLEAGRLVQLSELSVLDTQQYYMLVGSVAQDHMPQAVAVFRDWALRARPGLMAGNH